MAEFQDKERPLLSISLLVSNRIDTIRTCMESLRPLMEAVRSELIAVDTGGTDGSVDIVREYTDNIVKFQWCDDFAAARNAGLKLASGKWFLFLDDDEWFEDTREIEEFFLTGEYRNYKSAQYLVRNYAVGGSYADAYVSRLCQLNDKVRFEGSIHEYLKIEKGPVKYFNSYVHHYGYYYQTEEERQSHFERNANLLKKELKKNPTDIRLLCQLAQEYETIKDFEKEEAVCRLALNNISKDGVCASTGLNWIMAALVRILSFQGKAESALKEGRRILDKLRPYELSRAVIQAHMTEEALITKDYGQTISSALEYSKLINALEENPETASSQCMLTMTFSYAKDLYKAVMEEGMEACCASGDFSEAPGFLEWLFNEDKNTKLEETCFVMEQLKEKYPESVRSLMSAMVCLENPGKHPYLLLQQLLVSDEKQQSELQEIYDNCVIQSLKGQKFYAKLLSVAGQKRLKQTIMLEELERNEWEDWLCASLSCMSNDDLYGVKEGLEKTAGCERLKHLSFLVTLERQLLIREAEDAKKCTEEGNENIDGSGYITALTIYCQEGLLYFRRLYSQEAMQEEGGINLPKECRFLFFIEKALAAEMKNELEECLQNVRNAIHVNAPMAQILSVYVKLIEKKVAEPKTDEFLALGQALKKKARELIAIRETEAALAILRQLENLMPGDMDIILMLREVSSPED